MECGMGYYLILLRYAKKMGVFSEGMFRYMMVCQVLFGERLEVGGYEYFHGYFERMVGERVDEVIFLLEYLVRVMKSRSAVLLYFQAIL